MPLVFVDVVRHIVVAAVGSNADVFPDEAEFPHLAEIVFAPGCDFSVGGARLNPAGYSPRACARDAFVAGDANKVISSVQLQGFSHSARNRVLVERQAADQSSFAAVLR